MPPRGTLSCLHAAPSHASTRHPLMPPCGTLSCLHAKSKRKRKHCRVPCCIHANTHDAKLAILSTRFLARSSSRNRLPGYERRCTKRDIGPSYGIIHFLRYNSICIIIFFECSYAVSMLDREFSRKQEPRRRLRTRSVRAGGSVLLRHVYCCTGGSI